MNLDAQDDGFPSTALPTAVALALELISDDDSFRVLRRVDLPATRLTWGPTEGTHVGVCLDTETTGLDAERDAIVELALRRFRYDDSGRIVALDAPHSWLEDPGRPIDPAITRITGLSNADVEGRSIDAEAATALLNSASLVVCHNSRFDRDFVERRLPGVRGLRWSCSMDEVDWAASGFEGRAMRWLLDQTGWFYRAHRAGDDVDALLQLLRHDLPDGTTVLSHVAAAASRVGWLVRAEGAHYERREVLKARGYAWNAARKVWLREIADGEREAETAWLDREVYDFRHRPRNLTPRIDRIDATTRYRKAD
ncbi:3'-5' exonuclease [uncultured Sphingomonas sp.]|uniref:3'-5' exonuclease n=1 Tax=uncultured Sphingomonas sp. TaxID=158754 RepID=UPI0035CA39D3